MKKTYCALYRFGVEKKPVAIRDILQTAENKIRQSVDFFLLRTSARQMSEREFRRCRVARTARACRRTTVDARLKPKAKCR